MPVEEGVLGTPLDGGAPARTVTVRHASGARLVLAERGAAVLALAVPDRHGHVDDVTLGFDAGEDWLTKNVPYFGVVAGRFANRIARGRFRQARPSAAAVLRSPP